MGLLTSEQAMADFATLISYIKAKLKAPHAPVIGFGGSYGGMLGAWFRLKYPNAVDGVIAVRARVRVRVRSASAFAFMRVLALSCFAAVCVVVWRALLGSIFCPSYHNCHWQQGMLLPNFVHPHPDVHIVTMIRCLNNNKINTMASWFQKASAPIWSFLELSPPYNPDEFYKGVAFDTTSAGGAAEHCEANLKSAWPVTTPPYP